MSLFWWMNGASKETFDVLQRIGLLKCFDTVKNMIHSTGNYCILEARELAQGPDEYLFNYDNINLSTSIFVEQCPSAPGKVQSGTFPIIYLGTDALTSARSTRS
jgi:hypothetical protein